MRSASRNDPSLDAGARVEGVRVVGKAFAVLDAFSQDGPSTLSLGEIARTTGLPKPTVHRIITSLVAEGAVQRAPRGYQLGLKLFELGERVRMKRDLREAALPFLQDLYEATHQTVHLAILEGSDVVYVERIRGHHPIRLPSTVGGRLPAHCTGVGKALLAYDPDAIAALERSRLKVKTRHTIADAVVLRAELARVRDVGVAVDREEAVLGVHCVAAPIFVDGHAVAALSVSGSVRTLNVDALTVAVRSAANGVARMLRPASTR